MWKSSFLDACDKCCPLIQPVKRKCNKNYKASKKAKIDCPQPCLNNIEMIGNIRKNKLNEIKEWLMSNKAGFILLTGPPGCGKTATFLAVCNELKLHVVEYVPGCHERTNNLIDCRNYEGSQSNNFLLFIQQAARYNSSQLFSSVTGRKVVLVKDFPSSFLTDHSKLHGCLRTLKKVIRCPVAFVLTDNDAKSRTKVLFPLQIIEDCRIKTIGFNAITDIAMGKVLSTFIQQSSGKKHDVINQICEQSRGDIRSALNTVAFLDKDAGSISLNSLGIKDTDVSLYRLLGRIFYRKVKVSCSSDDSSDLPASANDFIGFERKLEDLVQCSPSTYQQMILFFSQNLIDFARSVPLISALMEKLSFYDLFNSFTWNSNSKLAPLPLTYLIRSYLLSANDSESHKFRPFQKPSWYEVIRQRGELFSDCLVNMKWSGLSTDDFFCDIFNTKKEKERFHFRTNTNKFRCPKNQTRRLKKDEPLVDAEVTFCDLNDGENISMPASKSAFSNEFSHDVYEDDVIIDEF